MRIRNYNDGSDNAAKDSLVVLDGRGVVHRIATSTLLANMDKSLAKYNYTPSTGLGVFLGYHEELIVFDNQEFDLKNEYDSTSGIFTAQQTGLYRIEGQIKLGLNLTIGFGLRLKKIHPSVEILADDSFTNFPGVARRFSTIVELNAGDQIAFYNILSISGIIGVSVSLSANAYDNYFTIEQVR